MERKEETNAKTDKTVGAVRERERERESNRLEKSALICDAKINEKYINIKDKYA